LLLQRHHLKSSIMRQICFEDLSIDHVNQVWAADITYVPMSRGFMCLVAVIDWHTHVFKRVCDERQANRGTTRIQASGRGHQIIRESEERPVLPQITTFTQARILAGSYTLSTR
jgi:hypothetical protein